MKTKNNHTPRKTHNPSFAAHYARLMKTMEEVHAGIKKPVDVDEVFKAHDRGEAYA